MEEARIREIVKESVADALQGAVDHLRAQIPPPVLRDLDVSPKPSGTLTEVLAAHPDLGHRQRQIVELLGKHGERGTDTGWLSRSMDYDQPNIYLTLQSLMRRRIVEKLAEMRPHRYRLTKPWLEIAPPSVTEGDD